MLGATLRRNRDAKGLESLAPDTPGLAGVALACVAAGGAGWYADRLDVRRGEIVTLIRPNGSGKSTTARTAIRRAEGRRGNGPPPGRPARWLLYRKSCPSNWTLPLTVERLMTLTGPLPKAEIAEALEAVGSRASRQWPRFSICRTVNSSARCWPEVMARKPDLLVLDEPVQGVDFFRRGWRLNSYPATFATGRLRHPADLTRSATWEPK